MEDFTFYSDDLVIFCSEFDNLAKTEITDSMLEVNLHDLNHRWSEVQRSYKELLINKKGDLDQKSLEAARGKYSTCTKSFHNCKANIFDLQKTFVASPISSSFIANDIPATDLAIKVPPCDTELFYGGYEEWPAFRDMFSAVYVDHPRLPPVQKLYHLRLKCRGQAGEIVKKYKLCGENFCLAWEALRMRYENKRILVDNQLKILLNLPPITSESCESLQYLRSTINDCLSALKAQNISTKDWDPILIYICSTKLPHETLSLWEQSLKSHKELPEWEQMDTFLSHRYEVVERLNSIQDARPATKEIHRESTTVTKNEASFPCKICKLNHPLKQCPEFKKLDPQSRSTFVSLNNICINCLSYTHTRKNCQSKFTCNTCNKNHHSLLHFTRNGASSNQKSYSPKSPVSDESQAPEEAPDSSYTHHSNVTLETASHFTSNADNSWKGNTLLPTAVVQIKHNGDLLKARAFLDQGSERSFVSKTLQQRLKLVVENKNFQIHGMGGEIVANSNSICSLTLYSEKHEIEVNLGAIVVPRITRLLPNFEIAKSQTNFSGIEGLELADPDFYTPGNVDLLLGSDVMPSLLINGLRKISESLLAQATIFGWIISGPIQCQSVSAFSIGISEMDDEAISTQLRRFWEQEEIPNKIPFSKEDEFCESLYLKTTYRNKDGRYVVKLPFKPGFPREMPLGCSRSKALIQFIGMENSLKKNSEFAETYRNVLAEYLTLGHMTPTSSQEIISQGSFHSYYMPHHAVMKPDSRSTKLRVVFNASRKSNSGNSLNDILLVGPTLQLDLMTLIVNWRLYQYVFCGDIEKMYRQILVHDGDTPFQRIVFRMNPCDPIQDFTLRTVTFGVNCAPYLAIRTLLQLAKDSEDRFPQAAHILRNETYVDDILTGSHDLNSAIKVLSQIITVLESAGFHLRKISANTKDILESVPNESLLDCDFLKFAETSGTKTLGIQWNALKDCFSYKIEPIEKQLDITKRKILSTVAKIFDPAGWISPIIIQSKMLLQHLWLEGTKWDESVKPNTLLKWNQFVDNIQLIPNIHIPRWVKFAPLVSTQIHGFCDASEKAYCAVIYLRVQRNQSTESNLFVSKTKVAPLEPVSLPRLELCGALLLSRLVKKVLSQLPINNYDLYLWCDSSIVLGWLEKPPSSWKTYVANRTAEIIRNIGNISWRHIRSADNPADVGSRGCNTMDLMQNSLWWKGPTWLIEPPNEWPKSLPAYIDPPEKKKINVFHMNEIVDPLERFSRWDRAIRVICYVRRFLHNSHKEKRQQHTQDSKIITHSEFTETKNLLITLAQRQYYGKEYHSLLTSKPISKKSPLYSLNPFIDKCGVLRASGRISNSDFAFNERHPIIVPVKSKYCTLLIEFTHIFLMHAEHNLMIRTIRSEYYVSRLRSAIKKCIHQCKTCIAYKQRLQTQFMAALPIERSKFSPPFTITGLDFAGPFPIKVSRLRQATFLKGYVCIFICLSTKSIHLELCSDLSSASFRAAFVRFVGRRGLPQKLMSDNGTNFVGAERAFNFQYVHFLKAISKDIVEKYATHGFQWTFIPPNAPHMGGIWEAGVKSFKMHFRKVTQNAKYTFEEFCTLLVRIEAVLNSRPLSPMTDDPLELLALTPGHFLRGAPMVAMPEATDETFPIVDKWDKLKSIQHQFARRWKDEYIKELQSRYKWQRLQKNLSVDQFVLIKDDSLPPCEWRLGRITKVYLGPDGLARVADIRTQLGTLRRPIVKLCILPYNAPQS
ncbi:uncharacterized protein LOC131996886 [Stomoxys calcitrans]|uniref:uncharacterized protein LOC131996886 n=1 Tax=Stomoxys calcitrans TaxID=35570 RepID=UPI0027E229FC|nr:uncharacterized protein LOC131996886 [Stomoxys calcitrans]